MFLLLAIPTSLGDYRHELKKGSAEPTTRRRRSARLCFLAEEAPSESDLFENGRAKAQVLRVTTYCHMKESS